MKRGIEDGKIDGDQLSFFARFDEDSGEQTVQHKTYYWGQVTDSRISMRLQDSRGSPPVDFVLKKSNVAR